MSFSWWIGTACGLGGLPKAPGTWASVAAALLYGFFFPPTASLLLQALFFFIILATFFAGVWAGKKLETEYG